MLTVMLSVSDVGDVVVVGDVAAEGTGDEEAGSGAEE